MTEEELKKLDKEVKKRKRIAIEWASQIHDLVEDRFLTDYHELTQLTENAIAACESWREASTKYQQVSA